MKILGYHIEYNTIMNSDGEYQEKTPYLPFLLTKKPSTIRVFYNLNESVDNLISMLNIGKVKATELKETTKLYEPQYHIRYVPCKLFSIKKPNAFSYYGDTFKYGEHSERTIERKAQKAKEIGEDIYNAMVSIGLKPINTLNPYKQYKNQITPLNEIIIDLYNKMESYSGVARQVIGEIYTEIDKFDNAKTNVVI